MLKKVSDNDHFLIADNGYSRNIPYLSKLEISMVHIITHIIRALRIVL